MSHPLTVAANTSGGQGTGRRFFCGTSFACRTCRRVFVGLFDANADCQAATGDQLAFCIVARFASMEGRIMMSAGFLLSRVLLRFEKRSKDIGANLSAVAFTPDGSLWGGSDEFTTLERLSPLAPYVFGDHRTYNVGDFVELANEKDEAPA
jgi:Protein of unknown function (DUF3616)